MEDFIILRQAALGYSNAVFGRFISERLALVIMASLTRAASDHLRTTQGVDDATTPRRPRLLRCNATEPYISTQSASRDVLISPASPTAVCLLNKMGRCLPTPNEADEVGEGEMLKHNSHVMAYSEQANTDTSNDYRTSCDAGTSPTGRSSAVHKKLMTAIV